MEDLGYDMSCYKDEEPIGGANARQADGTYVNAEKRSIMEGGGNQPEWNQKQKEALEEADKARDTDQIDRSKPWNNCNKECHICTHVQCPSNPKNPKNRRD